MKNTNETHISNKEYRENLKKMKAEHIAYSKAKDKAWQKMIRNLDYEMIVEDKTKKDEIYLKPRKLGKSLVK